MGDFNDKSIDSNNSYANAEDVAKSGDSHGIGIPARAYAITDGIEDVPNGCEEDFPYFGIINTTYNVRLHSNSKLGIKNTLADLPKGTVVHVIGAKHNMLKIEVSRESHGLTINKKGKDSSKSLILTGYVSQELVRSVNPRKNFCEEHPYADSQQGMTVLPDHLFEDEQEFEDSFHTKEFHLDGDSFSEELISSLIKGALSVKDTNTLSSANLNFKIKFGLNGTALFDAIEAGGGITVELNLDCGIGDSRNFSASVADTVGAYGEASVLWGLVDAEISRQWQSKETIATSTIEKFSAIIVNKVLNKMLVVSQQLDAVARANGMDSDLGSTAEDLHNKNVSQGWDNLTYTKVDTSSIKDSGQVDAFRKKGGVSYSANKSRQHFSRGDKERKSTTKEVSSAFHLTIKKGLKISGTMVDKNVDNHANSDNDGSYTDYYFDLEVPFSKVSKLKESLKGLKKVSGLKSKVKDIVAKMLEGHLTPSNVFSASAKIRLQVGYVNDGDIQRHLYTRLFVAQSSSVKKDGVVYSPGASVAGLKGKYNASASFENQRLLLESLGTDTLAYLSLVHNGIMGRGDKEKPELAWEQFKSKHRSSINMMVKKIRTGELDISQFSSSSVDVESFTLYDLELVLDEMQSYKQIKSM